MSGHSTTRHGSGNLAIRVVIWLLAMVATAGAVLSVDRVLRTHPASETAAPVILPPPPRAESPPGGETRSAARTVDTARAAEDAAGAPAHAPVSPPATPTGGTGGGDTGHDHPRGDQAGRDDGTPSFDIARVEPSGDTVVAGRAMPGATVELLRNGQVHDTVVADASGQFAMVPPRLPAGDSELTLRAKPAGGAPIVSKQTVVVSVQPNLKDQPMVALMAPDRPSVVLSRPAAPDVATGSVVVDTVEADAGGTKLYVTGHAAPGALIRLYLNDGYQSTATADGTGHVAFTAAGENAVRDYRVRLDEVDRLSGVIKSRAEVPFTAPQAVATAAPVNADDGNNAGADANTSPAARGDISRPAPRAAKEGQTVVVSRGDSLWRISRLAYGDGARYTVIYDANHRQIRNPNRIYPGQVFIIPGKQR